MNARKVLMVLILGTFALPLGAQTGGPIEPNAGNWRTWVISSGRDYRVPPPPGPADTQAELRALAILIAKNDVQAEQQIAFWDAGAPAYRWMDLLNSRTLAGTPTTTNGRTGVYTYVALAMHDATIAAWESKYAYNRPRPSERDHKLPIALPVPNSPSYPSEHAAAAQAAASVLAYFLPGEAQTFQTMAEQAGWSRVLAGLQYPSDYHAGLALGQKVAERVIAKAKADGSDAVWTGTVPIGPCKWLGTNPGQRYRSELRPLAADIAKRVQASAATGMRLAPGTGRDSSGSRFSAHVRNELQGLLLAKPGRSSGLALSVCRQMDVRRWP